MTPAFILSDSARRCILTAAVIGLAGCTTILDSQADGSSPAGAGPLAGAPSGDSMSAAGNVEFQQSSIQLITSAQTQTGVSFRPVQNHGNPAEYTIALSGVANAAAATPVVAIDIVDTAQRRACGLEIGNDEFRLVGGDGTTAIGSIGQADPSSESAEHRVTLRLSKTANRCFVIIRQFANDEIGAPLLAPVIEANASFTDANFDILDRVQIAWENVQSDTGSLRYILGPVTVTAR